MAIRSATSRRTSRISGELLYRRRRALDADGYYWLMGRVDDVINVSGHRLGTMEMESALVAHPKVAEAAVVGRPDEMKGQAIAAFVTLERGARAERGAAEELRAWVAKEIGALARPDDLRFTEMLPKTRSGKIMRRLLRELATTGEIKGDTTTLEEDRMTDVLEKLADYQLMGIPAIWLIEPKKPTYYLYSSGQLTPTAIFELPGTDFKVAMSEIAAFVN
jgi:hypothetical protein